LLLGLFLAPTVGLMALYVWERWLVHRWPSAAAWLAQLDALLERALSPRLAPSTQRVVWGVIYAVGLVLVAVALYATHAV
jgi:hypothetical protein